ncbi:MULTISPECIES: hypothetical protein [Methylobacterium]|jgi:hypothetical protein|uniref:hypothetical protein n=1 Tax=Methylobacterium TaxID=407 RepID=UPI0008E08A56|nr:MULTISPECIES: hypothetical protein [Methylobacterium]MBZ6417113.1 hypothetical protein [Methylobacterium sp.]MBK3395343.1 hypothetical protein [Methylobacterium ajmalii]MBK3407922.1 hypothetical protein [Methylobacterium ajmalii]MBK3420914.1 hypothetical protein [Methylobacterium ajmalii]SFF89263.1 hypothetical protein SAMN04487844_1702 [Methylobacterium sp. yr596]
MTRLLAASERSRASSPRGIDRRAFVRGMVSTAIGMGLVQPAYALAALGRAPDVFRGAVSIDRFGCRGDFDGTIRTDSTRGIARALAEGAPLIVPPGYYYSTIPIARTNAPLHVMGGGRGSAIVFPAGVAGCSVSQGSQDQSTHIDAVSLLTLGQESAIGASITYGASDSGQFRNDVRCNLNFVVCRGYNDRQHGWKEGIKAVDVHNMTAMNCNIVGRRDLSNGPGRSSFGTMDVGFHYVGTGMSSIPSDAMVFNPRVSNAKTSLLSEGYVEGMRVIEPVFVGVWQGLVARYLNARPWLRMSGGHISAIDMMFDLENCPDADIADLLFIKGGPPGILPDGTPGTLAGRIKKCDGIRIKRLKLENYAVNKNPNPTTGDPGGGAWNGFEITDTYVPRISDIEHIRSSTGLKLLGTTDGAVTRQYECLGSYDGETTVAEYVDLSTGQNVRIGGNVPIGRASNASAISLSATADKSVSIFIPRAEVGQTYQFDAHVQAQMGGTAGQVNVALMNDGGSATGAWDDTGAYVAERRDAAAGSTQEVPLTGRYRVTGRGSLVLKLSLSTPSTTGTVAAGKAQMSGLLL